jgi:hypothetical protein
MYHRPERSRRSLSPPDAAAPSGRPAHRWAASGSCLDLSRRRSVRGAPRCSGGPRRTGQRICSYIHLTFPEYRDGRSPSCSWRTPLGTPSTSQSREGGGAIRCSTWTARSSCAAACRAAQRGRRRGLLIEANRRKPSQSAAHSSRTTPVPTLAPIRNWIRRRHSLHHA